MTAELGADKQIPGLQISFRLGGEGRVVGRLKEMLWIDGCRIGGGRGRNEPQEDRKRGERRARRKSCEDGARIHRARKDAAGVTAVILARVGGVGDVLR